MFSELRASLGFSEAEVVDLLKISVERARAFETGEATPSARELGVLRGESIGYKARQRTLGLAPDLKQRSSRQKKLPRPRTSRTASAQKNSSLLPFPPPPRPNRHGNIASFRFVDLFAGIGGMRLGFESIGGECVFTSEWDRWSQKTYRANFQKDTHEIAGDIREIDAKDIPEHDVLLAGFPCQPFSIAGVSKKNALNRPHGFDCETQGTLFFEVERIIAARKPRAFLLENVRNLVSHDSGRTYKIIIDTLKNKLGYRVSSQTCRVIDARSWVPQHRERIFIVGFRDDTEFSLADLQIPDPSRNPTLESILHPEDGSEAPEPHYTEGEFGKVSKRYTLTQHLWTYLKDYAAKHRAAGNGFGFGLFGPDDVSRTLSARYYKDGSEILIKQKGRAPRRLTPRECARLMGFDAHGKSEWKIPVSDTQAYKQFGNAVVVPVVKAVARHMLPHLVQALTFEGKSRAVG